ncbi:type IX secretion system PorP/SprF family membrane protein [Nonlabens ulvanivorans]|uniref:Type IX secretion system PorP/SprF family membrane protein n=2 Tax=Nonlabens ulvanivorans TaxID=906888 RepID=A0ABX5EAS0_NONUL|nr:type IX secretion system PorP/SprF family membrane protein [Nonlabens ulvanivorans]
MMRKLLAMGIFLVLSGTSVLHAQQDPQYTQYMYNQNVINPAYAGTRDGLTLTTLYRQQWTGVTGAPETLTFSGSTPIGDRVGVGLSVISDQIGPVKEKNFYGDFSYKLQVGKKTTLSLGLKAGVTFHDVNLNFVNTTQPGDPLFSEQLNEQYLNLGAGAFLYGDNWYAGFSVPNMLNSTHLDEDGLTFGSETQHYFLTGGYVFDINENIKLKPHAMVKGAFDSPLSFDLNTNVLFNNKFEVGVSYRYEDSFSGLVGMQLTDNVKVGYAYDRVVSDIQVAANSSHEIFLTYDLNFPRKVMQSPRFF